MNFKGEQIILWQIVTFAVMRVKRLVIKSHASESEWIVPGASLFFFCFLFAYRKRDRFGGKAKHFHLVIIHWNHTAFCGSRPRWGAGRYKERKVRFLSSGIVAATLEVSLDWQDFEICKESQDLTTGLLRLGKSWASAGEDGPLRHQIPQIIWSSASQLPDHLGAGEDWPSPFSIFFLSSPSALFFFIFLFPPLLGSGKEPLFLSAARWMALRSSAGP